jgi:hypothetical protein
MMYVEHVFLLQSTCTRARDVRVYHRIRDTIITISIIENTFFTHNTLTIVVSSIYHLTFFVLTEHVLFNNTNISFIVCVYCIFILSGLIIYDLSYLLITPLSYTQ